MNDQGNGATNRVTREFRTVLNGAVGDTTPDHDPINHPSHYISDSGLEVVEVIEAFARTNSHRSQSIKYLLRAGRKPGADGVTKRAEDLKKAMWWIKRELAFSEAQAEGRVIK